MSLLCQRRNQTCGTQGRVTPFCSKTENTCARRGDPYTPNSLTWPSWRVGPGSLANTPLTEQRVRSQERCTPNSVFAWSRF